MSPDIAVGAAANALDELLGSGCEPRCMAVAQGCEAVSDESAGASPEINQTY